MDTQKTYASYLKSYFACLGALLLLALFAAVPYSAWWIYESGAIGMERAVAAQARGDFVLFGSGISQDFIRYKLALYDAVKPRIAALGSSRVMQFRGSWFGAPFVNMGGCAGNLAELRYTVDGMLSRHRPEAVIIGLDFWWFMPRWESEPHKPLERKQSSYNYSIKTLRKPWRWLLKGKISLREFGAPLLGLFGEGFRMDRYGILAQQTHDGFGPDGSWYYTAQISGQKAPFDFQFAETLDRIRRGKKAFYHAVGEAPSEEHIDALCEIICRLASRRVRCFVFIPPLAGEVFSAVNERREAYVHLFRLREALQQRGIDALDFSDPRFLSSGDCEFIDGFHGGEVTYARILRALADHWPALRKYVNMTKVESVIREWSGNAFVPDERVTSLPEVDFNRMNCAKRAPNNPAGAEEAPTVLEVVPKERTARKTAVKKARKKDAKR